MKSQNAQILAHLKQEKWITAMHALNCYNCFRLAARICDLRDQGYVIDTVMFTDVDTQKRYAMYMWSDQND